MSRIDKVLVVTILLAGCVADQPGPPSGPPSGNSLQKPPVVAILDSGINPYHEAFAAKGDDSFSVEDATTVELASNGSLDERIAADQDVWDSVELGRLYRFNDSRLFAITFGGRPGEPLIDSVGHGTKVASVITAAFPDVVVVLVQVNDASCVVNDPLSYCPILVDLADAMEWVANQSWIDVVSISIALTGNPPADERAQSANVDRFLAAQQKAHDDGKLIVNGAGNMATPALMSYLGGPPWVIAVGGVDPVRNGDSPQGGHGADVVANFTAVVADPVTIDAWTTASGTSFGTPLVAAVLAGSLHDLRLSTKAAPAELRQQVRDALNKTATLLSPEDWDPTGDPLGDPTVAPGIPVLLSGPQTGWGRVNSSLRDQIVSEILAPGSAAPKSSAQIAYMQTWADAREQYWSR